MVLQADAGEASLASFRDRRRFQAPNGRPGEGGRRTGRDGETLVLRVPPGTVVREGGTVLADLDTPGARCVVVAGGGGGRGNARFASSTRQAPRVSELGEPGEHRRIHLELKLIADVGLVGLPNAGKSTLLAALTAAHPKIAAYPFTTLEPNLGVAEAASGRPLLIADVPGLIEGAHTGAGLGMAFLRHLERTRVLIHVVDAAAGLDAARQAIRVIDGELSAFSPALAARPRLLALNKVDDAAAATTAAALRGGIPEAFAISAMTGAGCDAVLEAAAALVGAATAAPPPPPEHRRYMGPRPAPPLSVSREGGGFRVHGGAVERMVARTDLDSDEAVTRLQRRLRRAGVDDAVRAAGAAEGDTVRIGDAEFLFSEDAV